ncbi:hypothetical protein A4D02_07770 [Niastella koreensis]|uniref:Uncharacterized protein n=2 Tax=Niastella koreensis TaxID=354356 RepID=G8TL52_NIAKG|nr:DUF4173 domain-containing protein [Niastella koreensis]AEW01893.1 hypothetical protein Niako_5661 [Niastella koreensis GR20-10]OQP48597.1 hypothetical protein A4D02_07770 [Niastella koreensis]
MNKDLIKIILVTAGAVLFNLVFWNEKLAINTVLFDAFLLSALFFLYPNARKSATVNWLLLGHLVSLTMVVIHNTDLSKISFVITLLLVAGFAEYTHRSVWFASGSILMNVVMVVASFLESFKINKAKPTKRKGVGRFIRFAIFPLILLVVFFLIYRDANNAFSDIANRIGAQLEIFFGHFFDFFSLQRLLFLLLGLLISGSILLKSKLDYFSTRETNMNDGLQRSRKTLRQKRSGAMFQFIEMIMGKMANGMMALKNENTTGIISLVLLNVLLLAVNCIDVNFLWLHFQYKPGLPVYKMVHEGTELLIVSIVLAMAILLFYFKGNLNFYKRNNWLKYGAYAWIIQNAMLVSSVFLRDYYYILKHGLAYKRIGVLFFLVMVLVGLLTVFLKIWSRRTNYFLFRVNAWAAIVVLVLATTIHWDEFIAGYNLKRKNTVDLDVPFLLSLSDKALPLLDTNIVALQKRENDAHVKNPDSQPVCDTCYIEELKQRELQFVEKQKDLTWLSWNYADAYTTKYFQKKGLITSIH